MNRVLIRRRLAGFFTKYWYQVYTTSFKTPPSAISCFFVGLEGQCIAVGSRRNRFVGGKWMVFLYSNITRPSPWGVWWQDRGMAYGGSRYVLLHFSRRHCNGSHPRSRMAGHLEVCFIYCIQLMFLCFQCAVTRRVALCANGYCVPHQAGRSHDTTTIQSFAFAHLFFTRSRKQPRTICLRWLWLCFFHHTRYCTVNKALRSAGGQRRPLRSLRKEK